MGGTAADGRTPTFAGLTPGELASAAAVAFGRSGFKVGSRYIQPGFALAGLGPSLIAAEKRRFAPILEKEERRRQAEEISGIFPEERGSQIAALIRAGVAPPSELIAPKPQTGLTSEQRTDLELLKSKLSLEAQEKRSAADLRRMESMERLRASLRQPPLTNAQIEHAKDMERLKASLRKPPAAPQPRFPTTSELEFTETSLEEADQSKELAVTISGKARMRASRDGISLPEAIAAEIAALPEVQEEPGLFDRIWSAITGPGPSTRAGATTPPAKDDPEYQRLLELRAKYGRK